MGSDQLDKRVARKSAQVYILICIGVVLAFLMASSLAGNYPLVARIGGAVWTGLLTLIVAMPLVISYFKRRLRATSGSV